MLECFFTMSHICPSITCATQNNDSPPNDSPPSTPPHSQSTFSELFYSISTRDDQEFLFLKLKFFELLEKHWAASG